MKRMIQFLTAAALCACMLSLIILPAAADSSRSPGKHSSSRHRGMQLESDSRSSLGSSEALATLLTALTENGTITEETCAAISALLPQADEDAAKAEDPAAQPDKQSDVTESRKHVPHGRDRKAMNADEKKQAGNSAAETDAVSDDQTETASILDEETLVQLLESGILTQEEYDSLLYD